MTFNSTLNSISINSCCSSDLISSIACSVV